MLRRDFLSSCLGTGLSTALPLGLLPGALRAEAAPLKLRELYNKDKSFSGIALGLEGKPLTVEGFMAPPLKADSTFFVLTKMPMSVCPFCETEADWPADILAIYTRRTFRTVSYSRKIEVSGLLELGPFRDPDTGFLSRVRLTGAHFDIA
ncbi:hypothetical protein [Poseidonocella sedimentorum]|uniref:DUF3299 domain-containing protein n=1 Tax=Poseidonocella sedimentorum TaxID=871652 RepID=A0A1I6DDR4_9RHOB|nr:hypothetical protein [Poseidonocella sedimentorum]SFR03589.1 hypothetical protein SAMN04515673_10339 [Poseidonocella sedimentorum]